MILSTFPIEKSLNRAYLKQDLTKKQMEVFRNELKKLLDTISQLNNQGQDEENFKTPIIHFLTETYYKGKNYVNSSKKYDLVIGNGEKVADSVAVIIETKRPSNTAEMITSSNPNAKALHELVHYYMQERKNGNDELKYLVITNCYEWYLFDAVDFENIFYKNQEFRNNYENWDTKQKVDNTTVSLYENIRNFIDKNVAELKATYFDLRDYEAALNSHDSENLSQLINLYKIFSPEHLLKKPFANDSNTLNKEFYNELLYILGLEEKSENNKIVIERRSKDRSEASLIENTINILKTRDKLKGIEDITQFGQTEEEQLFSVALELCITWLNRILFLKLLEGQLIKYHNNDSNFAFLSPDKVKEFDKLDELFFEVFAIKPAERTQKIQEQYAHIPYLNSSLFEMSLLEQQTISIANLKNDQQLPIYNKSVLKIATNKKEINTLQYLLQFLSSYNFSSDSHAKIQEDNRTIINASVLGLIFEKINGYKDGAFFTPGFITMFMSRETIRKAVVQKFREKENKEFNDFDDVKNYCRLHHKKEDIERFNEHINSLKICDPAVGSGHFLVSALNELIAVKSELNILSYNGIIINWEVSVDNDELTVTHKFNNQPYEYFLMDDEKPAPDAQEVQMTLFNEKRLLIENCLFGVDINPKSVLICRLRLWIELLKNAYYKAPDFKELETLPNIDINIKCGDSLISRFNLTDKHYNLLPAAQQKIRYIIQKYKQQVIIYKSTTDRATRHQTEQEIQRLKKQFMSVADPSDTDYKKWKEKQNEYLNFMQQPISFEENAQKEWKNKLDELSKEVHELEEIYNEKLKTIYNRAFEWRFEFPEVLDDDGNFVGFDVVIGNPPYIQLQKAYDDKRKFADLYQNQHYETFDRTGDIYCLFYEKGITILKNEGLLCYISSNKWMRAGYGEKLRTFFLKYQPLLLVDLGAGVFESATVDTNILLLQKSKNTAKTYLLQAVTIQKTNAQPIDIAQQIKEKAVILQNLTKEAWYIGNEAEQQLKKKIERIGKPLKNWNVKIYRGILTGLNEAFIIDNAKRQEILDNCMDDAERERTAAIIKPILRGRDIKRYYYEWAGLWVIGTFPALKLNIEDYPAIKKYFLDNFDIRQLEQSGKKYPELGFNARKKTNNKWFEIQDTIAYYEEFEKEKIVYGQFQDDAEYALAEKGIYLSSNEYMIGGDYNKKYFLAVLNSNLIKWYLKNITGTLGSSMKIGQKSNFEKIPIPPITPFNEPIVKQIEELVDKILVAKMGEMQKVRTQKSKMQKDVSQQQSIFPPTDTTPWEQEIDRLVYALYELTDEEINIVES